MVTRICARACRVWQDILIGGDNRFFVLALDQTRVRRTAQDGVEFPGKIVGIRHPAIAAARTEGRNKMGTVTGKDHAVMHEPAHPAALEGVDAVPFLREFGVIGCKVLRSPGPINPST